MGLRYVDQFDKDMAKTFAFQCVRNNTSLEKLHCEGKISDDEMRVLMQEITNNAYFMLYYLRNREVMEPLFHTARSGTRNWDEPKRVGSLWGWLRLYTSPRLKT